MKKIAIIASALGLLFLTAAPVFAKESTRNSRGASIPICLKTVTKSRDLAKKDSLKTKLTEQKAAQDAHKVAVKTARALTDATAKKDALKKAETDLKAAIKTVEEKYKTAIKAADDKAKTDLAACKA